MATSKEHADYARARMEYHKKEAQDWRRIMNKHLRNAQQPAEPTIQLTDEAKHAISDAANTPEPEFCGEQPTEGGEG